MIGKRWNRLSNASIILATVGILSIAIGAVMLYKTTTPFSSGFVFLIAAIFLFLFISAVGDVESKGKSLTEKDLVENKIYQLVGPPVISQEHEEVKIFHTFLRDRDGCTGAFRLSKHVPSIFKVVLGKDGERQYEPYPEPEPEG
ncbi:hypothetical protein LCGC14_1840210 [marine sediment metagenome]|uniref:Uncharacterized protein n=1 Tax=marine sediment metagenome TaxID=412755 RepID=A0A0F9JCW9_9ZZZZ